jgi:hypothetical protein
MAGPPTSHFFCLWPAAHCDSRVGFFSEPLAYVSVLLPASLQNPPRSRSARDGQSLHSSTKIRLALRPLAHRDVRMPGVSGTQPGRDAQNPKIFEQTLTYRFVLFAPSREIPPRSRSARDGQSSTTVGMLRSRRPKSKKYSAKQYFLLPNPACDARVFRISRMLCACQCFKRLSCRGATAASRAGGWPGKPDPAVAPRDDAFRHRIRLALQPLTYRLVNLGQSQIYLRGSRNKAECRPAV